MTILQTQNQWWLPRFFSAAMHGLDLSTSMLHRTNHEQVLSHIDEARLLRLVEPLPLSRPSQVEEQINREGGPEILLSDSIQAAISSWGKARHIVRILSELSKAVSALLSARRRGELTNPPAVLRALPVLVMTAFIPGSETLRQDLAAILGGSPENVQGLIKGYRTAVLSGDNVTVSAIDNRISADATWSVWVQTFLKEGDSVIRLCRPTTYWEFSELPPSGETATEITSWLFRR